MLMETKFARFFASDDTFTVKSYPLKNYEEMFCLHSEEPGKLPLITVFAHKNRASFHSQASTLEEVEIKQLRNLTKNLQNQNPVMVSWN